MTRLVGTVFVILAFGLGLTGVSAQPAKGKLDIEAVFRKLDTNHDGKLQRDEFLKLCDSFKNKDKAREKLTVAFDTIDADHVGYLSKEQFQKYLESGRKKG